MSEATGMKESVEHPKERYDKPPFKASQKQATPGFECEMTPQPDFGLRSYCGSGKLQDKVAIITGGDSGIGRAVCLAFAREGAHIICCYLNEHQDAHETEKYVKDENRKCLLLPGDLQDESYCKQVIDRTVEDFGKIDLLINNAAYQGPTLDKVEDFDTTRIEYTFKVNILSMFHLVRFALPHMKPGSSIINVGSVQGYDPSAEILDYAVTKGAIISFTKALSCNLIDRGIRVNCIAPGPVWTPLIVQSFKEKKIEEFGKKYPMGRPAQPAELAPSFVFLACQSDSNYVNGEVMNLTGGKPIQ